MLGRLTRFHEDAEITVSPCGTTVSKCPFPMFAINEAAVLQITERKPNCNTAYAESAAELMFARDGEGRLFVALKNLVSYGGDEPGSGC
jgi:hypothetical protein